MGFGGHDSLMIHYVSFPQFPVLLAIIPFLRFCAIRVLSLEVAIVPPALYELKAPDKWRPGEESDLPGLGECQCRSNPTPNFETDVEHVLIKGLGASG